MLERLREKIIRKMCKKKPMREVVLIFPFNTKTNELFIIQEYIHHYKKSFWKFVSGGVDKDGKDLITHAIEELAEEVSMESQNLYHFYSYEKIFGNRGIHCYVAENPTQMEIPIENPDTDIIETGEWVSEDQLQKMIDTKEIIWNEGSIVALQIFRKYKMNEHEFRENSLGYVQK